MIVQVRLIIIIYLCDVIVITKLTVDTHTQAHTLTHTHTHV